MKLTLILLLTLTSGLSIQVLGAQQAFDKKTFLTVEEYPYKRLVRLSDKVLIHHFEVENGIQCKTEVQHQGKSWTSDAITVERDAFTRDALRACFQRGEAKAILSRVFDNR